jgi:hypothetical protein
LGFATDCAIDLIGKTHDAKICTSLLKSPSHPQANILQTANKRWRAIDEKGDFQVFCI